MKLRLGTRGSALALTQSETVAARLREAGHEVELVVIRTAGDRSQSPSFGSIGAQGVFVRDIERALLDDRIDLAVHSFKDLPTASPKELVIAAIPPRVDAADMLIVRESAYDEANADGDAPLPLGAAARVGTSSVRRAAWIRHFRSDLATVPLRGNVPTRIGKLRDGAYEAIVLAAAGMTRLTESGDSLENVLTGLVTLRLDPRSFVPAPAQGALAVQCRAGRTQIREILTALDDAPTRTAVTIERDALHRAEGGCNTAFGAYCEAVDSGYAVTAMLERGGRIMTVEVTGETAEAVDETLWRRIEDAGE